jgi:hypothetical protein
VLFTLVPPSLLLTPIGPVVHTVTFLLIIQVLPVVPHTVGVNVDSVAGHVVVCPLTEVFAAVLPQITSKSIDLVVEPLAFVV